LHWVGFASERGEPAIAAICALHNESQGHFIALQQIVAATQLSRASGLKRINHFNPPAQFIA
jgi:hypothetical protein